MKTTEQKGKKQPKTDRKGGTALWELIQSLSSTEKASFTKMHAKAGKEDLFKQLFDDLNKVEAYDEAQFCQQFAHRPYQSNFTYQKNYLYQRLLKDVVVNQLKALETGPGGKELGVRSLLEQGKFLRDKRLIKQAQKRLHAAKEEALNYEFHEMALEILRTIRAMLVSSQIKDYEAPLEKLHEEIRHTIAIIQNKFQILAERDRALQAIRKDASAADTQQLAIVLDNKLLTEESKALSTDARISQLLCQVTLYLMLGKMKEAWTASKQVMDQWENKKQLKQARPLDYRNSLYNYLNLSNELGVYDQFEPYLKQLIQKPFSSSIEQGEMENHHLFLRLQYAVNHQQWQVALAIEQEFNRREPKLKKVIQHTRYISYAVSFGLANLMEKKYGPADHWLNRAIHKGNPQVAKHLRRLSRILIMAHAWETNDLDELDSIYRSITRQANWETEYAQWEQLAIKTLQQLPNQTDTPPHHLLQQLAHDIDQKTQDEYTPGAKWLGLWIDGLGG